MGRELRVVWIGRERRDPWAELVRDYRRRLERWIDVRDAALRPRSDLEGDERLRAEAEAVEGALPSPGRLVTLDRRGRGLTSRELARTIGRMLDDSPHPIAFVVGSDLGLDRELVRRADLRLSLGPLTLPHRLARLVLYEQLYRALSLRHGIKYHRGPS